MNTAELASSGRELSHLLNEAHQLYDSAVEQAAKAEKVYREGRHVALVQCPPGTVDFKKSWVDNKTADLRYARDLSEGNVKGYLELIRSRRQMLSLLQTQANQSKEEAAFARTG